MSKTRHVQRFSKNDDSILKECVEKYGKTEGYLKAMKLLNREKRQVRERYEHFIEGKSSFSNTEMLQIVNLRHMGFDFHRISKEFPKSTYVTIRIAYKHTLYLMKAGKFEYPNFNKKINKIVKENITTPKSCDIVEPLFAELENDYKELENDYKEKDYKEEEEYFNSLLEDPFGMDMDKFFDF